MRPFTASERLRCLGEYSWRAAPFLARLRWPHTRIHHYQTKRLRSLLDRVEIISPFYREKFRSAGIRIADIRCPEDLRFLPVTTKEELRAAAVDGTWSTAIPSANGFYSQSSGTTGAALRIVCDLKAMLEYGLATYRCYAMLFPYYPWRRMLYVYTSPFPARSFCGLYPMIFVPTLAPIDELIAAIRSHRPHLLVLYPSCLRALAGALSSEDARDLGIQIISVNSEQSTGEERAMWARHFNARVFDEYSSEELGRIASHCTSHTYHIFEDLNIIEVVDEHGREASRGELIGTNLINMTTPFIRYRQGDYVAREPDECPCGSTMPALRVLEGRINDDFIMPDGRQLTSGYLLDATYHLLLSFPEAIDIFQLTQIGHATAEFKFVPGPCCHSGMLERIRVELTALLDPFSLSVCTVGSFSGAGEKHRPIRRLYQP